MPSSLLDLPREILANTLSFLPANDLESCKLINRYIRNTISGSARLRYLIALGDACMEDNPYNHLTIPEKLGALVRREFAWRTFRPDFVQSITVDQPSSGIYDLTNGVCFLGARDGFNLHYLKLPTLPSQTLTWSRISTDRKVVAMGLAIHESDLVAIITSGLDPNFTEPEIRRFRIELNLLSFVTGKPHPLAETPTVLIGSIWVKPSISIEIMGDHIVLVTTRRSHQSRLPDPLYLWNWKTGALLIDRILGHGRYSSVIFLTADLLLLPNLEDKTFEFWRIPSSLQLEKPNNPIYAICLPTLTAQMKILRISCRGEPNPVGPGYTPNSGRPFHASSLQAILLFRIYIQSIFERKCTLSLVVHRQSLIDVFNKHAPQASENAPHLGWSDWGPPVTRWIDTQGTPTRWITTTSGQRCVLIPTETPSPITIYDFNPRNVAKMKDYLQRYPSSAMSFYDEEERLYDGADIFEVSVHSALPYCSYESEEGYFYDGVFIDEERLLGIKTDGLGAIISIDVMHFG